MVLEDLFDWPGWGEHFTVVPMGIGNKRGTVWMWLLAIVKIKFPIIPLFLSFCKLSDFLFYRKGYNFTFPHMSLNFYEFPGQVHV